MELKTDGECEMRRAVRFLQGKAGGSDVKQPVFAVSFLVPPPHPDPADGQSEVAAGAYDEVSEENIAIFYAGLTEAEILQFENKLRRILKNYEEIERYGK